MYSTDQKEIPVTQEGTMEVSKFEEITKKFTDNVIVQMAELDTDQEVQEFIRNCYEALVGVAYLYNSNMEQDPMYGVVRTKFIFGKNELVDELREAAKCGRDYSSFRVGGIVTESMKEAYREL